MTGTRESEIAALERRAESAKAQGPAAEGRAWAELARAHAAWDDISRANEAMAQAEARLHPAGQATDPEGKREWLRLRGAIANARGRLEAHAEAIGKAADAFEEAARLGTESGDRELRAEALLSLAAANARLGKVLDGALQAEEAEDLFVESGARTGDVAARAVADQLAATIMSSDDLSQAADEDLDAERKEGKDPRRLGWRLRMNASCFLAGDDEEGFEDAFALLEDAAAAFRKAESRSGEARAIRSQGACLAALGETSEAAASYLEAAAIYAELGANLPQARAMLEAGHASRAAEEIKRAEDCYAGAAKIFKEQEATFEEGFVTEALADLRLESEETEEARRLYEKALGLYGGAGGDLDDQRAGCLLSLGIACREAGDREEAAKRLSEARALFDKAGDTEMVADCDRELRKVAKRK